MTFDLNLGNILFSICIALVALVYNTLRQEIARVDVLVKTLHESQSRKVEAAQGQIAAVGEAIAKLGGELREQLKRVELGLANHYPTKDDLRAATETRSAKMEHLEARLENVMHALARLTPTETQAKRRRS